MTTTTTTTTSHHRLASSARRRVVMDMGASGDSSSSNSSDTTRQQQQQQQPQQQRRTTCFPGSIPVTTNDNNNDNNDDVQVMIRQTGQVAPSQAAIGIPQRCACQYGFPQAFALDPLPSGNNRMNSGLLKLTCPLLVLAIDALEDEGYIPKYTEQFFPNKDEDDDNADENNNNIQQVQIKIAQAHQIHAQVRHELLQDPSERDAMEQRLGPAGALAFMTSGVAGVSPKDKDVKCLHAWFADYLFRGPEASPIGALVAQALADRGVDVTGTPTCQGYCRSRSSDGNNNATTATTTSTLTKKEPPKPRNKQRLKTSKELARRKRRRQEQQQEKKKMPPQPESS